MSFPPRTVVAGKTVDNQDGTITMNFAVSPTPLTEDDEDKIACIQVICRREFCTPLALKGILDDMEVAKSAYGPDIECDRIYDRIFAGMRFRPQHLREDLFYLAQGATKRTRPLQTTTSVIFRDSLFGHSITAVVRWMGKESWTFPEAQLALLNLQKDLSPSTIRAQLLAGKKGERGDPAALTKEQEDTLWNALETTE